MNSRVRTQLNPPYDDGGDEDSGEEVRCELIVSGCDAAEVLDAYKHSLDEIALAVGDGIVRNGDLSCRVTGDDRLGALFGDQVAPPVGVIGLVGEPPGEGADRRGQSRRNRDIAGVAGGQRQDPRPAPIIPVAPVSASKISYRRP